MNAGGEPLGAEYFQADPVTCARGLIGCVFQWQGCSAVIVETEAYAALGDAACHTATRPSSREFVMRHDPGTAYVYLNYGVHWLFNILVKGPEGEGFVLFRALEPREGISMMRTRRPKCRTESDFCSGPGKLTQAMGINGNDHGREFLGGPDTGILYGEPPVMIAEAPRIGISRATNRLWRFCSPQSDCLSAPA